MHELIKITILILLSLIPYIFSLDGDFVFDDSEAIVKNKDLNLEESFLNVFHHDFWGSNITSKLSHKSYRPLTVLTFRLNKQIDNNTLDPFHFKITNLFLHCIVTVLLYYFANCVYKYRRKAKSKAFDCAVWNDVPFLSSVLFSVHPVHVEAVSGIVGRADVLAAAFFFSSLISYDWFVSGNALYERSTFFNVLYLIWSVLFAFLATLSKETGITALCVCNVYDIIIVNKMEPLGILKIFSSKFKAFVYKDNNYYNKAYTSISKNVLAIILRQLLLLVSFFTILYIRWAIMDYEGPKFQDTDNPAALNDSKFVRIMTYNYIYFINILIMIWPQWLCFDWSMGCIPLLKDFFDYRIIFVITFWSSLLLIVFRLFSKKFTHTQNRQLTMALCLLIIPFIPASNVFLTVGFVIAERILYVPSIGFCVLVAQGLTNILANAKPNLSKMFKAGFVSLVCIMILRSRQRSFNWISESSLYSSGNDVCPLNAKVHYNIAKNAGDKNNIVIAEKEYKEAIRLNPMYYQAMNNLANLLKDRNRFLEAETYLKNALKIKEDFPAAWMNLGIVLANLKQLSQSEHAYKEALKYRKNYADCYYNLGNLYLDQNKIETALKSWSEAININRKHAVAWSNMFALLDNTGQIERALKLIPEVISLLPEVPAIHFNVANIFGKNGDFIKAEKHFKQAIDLKKENMPAVYYANLGVLYHRWKKPNLAIEMYKKALSINPVLKSAKENLQKLTNPSA